LTCYAQIWNISTVVVEVFQHGGSAMRFTDKNDVMWRCVSQMHDTVDNDNMTAFMMTQAARDTERWAASRASNAAFATVCHAATVDAAAMRKEARSVRR
jgi:hypothetical protein